MFKYTSRAFFQFSQAKLPETSHKPQPYNGTPYEQIVKDRSKYMPNFYFHYYKQPLLITEGHLQYLWDHKGNRYLDLISGISTVALGHSHPAITKVVTEQVQKLTHTSPIYLSESQAEYSKKLCEELGGDYDSVYICNSGGEANDFAVYLSRLYTQEYKFLSLRNGYHGLVGNAGNITNVGTWNSPMRGGFEFEKLSWPSTYRGHNLTAEQLVSDAREAINSNTNGKVSGFIFECIQGVGGINPLPQGYLPEMVKLVKSHGGLIICDEVQTGFGRVGTQYWGHKWQGIKPDIITMAKGIGNGFPIGAVVTRKEVTDKIKSVFFNTFGGGHIQCKVGLEVLNTIRKEKLAENAETVGNYLLTELTKLKEKHRIIGDVRGKGLMIGIELVKDKNTKEPAKDEANQLMELTRERQLLFGKGGVHGNVFRIQPPLCLSLDDAKYLVQAFEDAVLNVKS